LLFTITGKHIEITDALKEHAEKKTAKLQKYYDRINKIEVIIDGDDGGGKKRVEIIAKGGHNKVFVVRESSEDAYSCIDAAVHKLEKQLCRKKSKERDNKYPGGREKE
jgi:putative sigma-54 modulation protein